MKYAKKLMMISSMIRIMCRMGISKIRCLILFFVVCLGPSLKSDLLNSAPEKKGTEKKTIRYSAAKGVFYPGSAQQLTAVIQKALHQAVRISTIPANQSVVLIVPHAGYDYCPEVFAQAYAQLKGQKFDHIVLISGASQKLPAKHQTSQKNGGISVFWTSGHNFWETPLGHVSVDPITQNLAKQFNNPWTDHPDLHKEESRIEIQLPWLQTVFSSSALNIIPILIDDMLVAENAASFLYQILKEKRVLYIVSTNLSTPASQTVKEFLKMDSQQFLKYLQLNVEPFSSPEAVYMALRLKEMLNLPAFHLLKENIKSSPTNAYASLITANP